MEKIYQFIILIVFNLYSVSSIASWTTSIDKDEMTGKVKAYALSSATQATKSMGFPYKDVSTWLGVGCDKQSKWVFVGFSSSPNLNNTKTEDGYNKIKTRIKWDDKVEEINLTQDWGAKFIHFSNDEIIMKKIAQSNSVLLELNWHGEGSRFFNYDLTGSSRALKVMGDNCGFKLKKINFDDKFNIALLEFPFNKRYGISYKNKIVTMETQGGSWKPYARDNSTVDRISNGLEIIESILLKQKIKFNLTIDVWGTTSRKKRDRDGGYPFKGEELKALLDKSLSKHPMLAEHITTINVGENEPTLYGDDSEYEILRGTVQNTNEKIEVKISFP